MITISDTKNTLPAIQPDDYKAFFHQEKVKFLNGASWQKIVESFWREMRLSVSPNDAEALVLFLRNKRDAILQAYKQAEFFVFWNRCFDSATKQFDEEKFIRLLCIAYSNSIERSDLDAFFAWHCLTGCIDDLLSRVLERQNTFTGATINFFYNDGGEIHFGTPTGKETNETPVEEDPLRNIIFSERLFDSNARLSKLRDTIAAAIDMGDATIMYGEPQEVRINPAVQSEWYYIIKALEEARVTRSKISVTGFIEQVMEWYPMLFPDGTKEEWNIFKKRLSKAISEEKKIWRKGNSNKIVSLREMLEKGIKNKLGVSKAERIYKIAYKGLYHNLESLKTDIQLDIIKRGDNKIVIENVYGDLVINKNVNNQVNGVGSSGVGININKQQQ